MRRTKGMKTLDRICVYTRYFIQRVAFTMSDEQRECLLKDLPELDDKIQQIPRKGSVKVEIKNGNIVYKYKYAKKGKPTFRPTIYFDPNDLKFRVTIKAYKKYGKEGCSNQAHFLIQHLHTLGYIDAKWSNFRTRPNLREKDKERAIKERLRRLKEKKIVIWSERARKMCQLWSNSGGF
jgi:hypothetical protein